MFTDTCIFSQIRRPCVEAWIEPVLGKGLPSPYPLPPWTPIQTIVENHVKTRVLGSKRRFPRTFRGVVLCVYFEGFNPKYPEIMRKIAPRSDTTPSSDSHFLLIFLQKVPFRAPSILNFVCFIVFYRVFRAPGRLQPCVLSYFIVCFAYPCLTIAFFVSVYCVFWGFWNRFGPNVV